MRLKHSHLKTIMIIYNTQQGLKRHLYLSVLLVMYPTTNLPGTSHSPMYPQGTTDSSGSHPGPTPASPLPGEFGELDQTDFEHFMQFIEAQRYKFHTLLTHIRSDCFFSDSASAGRPGPSQGPPVHFTINRPYDLSQLSPNDSSASFAAHTSASSTSSLSSLLAEHLEGIAALLKRPGDQHSYNSLVNILSQPFPSTMQSPIPPLTLPQFRTMYPVFGSLLGLMSAFAISAAAERPRHDFYILYAVLGQRDTLRVVALDAFRETVTSYTADIKNPAVEQCEWYFVSSSTGANNYFITAGFNYTQLIVEHLIDEILSEFHQMDGNVNTNSFLTDYGFKLPLHETNAAHNCRLYRMSTKDGQFLHDQVTKYLTSRWI